MTGGSDSIHVVFSVNVPLVDILEDVTPLCLSLLFISVSDNMTTTIHKMLIVNKHNSVIFKHR